MGRGQPSPLVTCLVDDGAELSARVERLLRAAPPGEESERAIPVVASGAAAAVLAGAAALMLQPATLHTAHRLFEQLMH